MTVFEIPKEKWNAGLDNLQSAYRLYGPVKEGKFYDFKALAEGQAPDLDFLNTRLSAKSLVYPQSEAMFTYNLSEAGEDPNILKEAPKDYSPQAIIGIRPCDAKAYLLVRKNFHSPEYRDPYWCDAYESLTLVGLACDSPCSTCFCTSSGCGPFHEEGLDVLMADTGDAYLARALTEKGEALAKAAGWEPVADGITAEETLAGLKEMAEEKIVSEIKTDKLAEADLMALHAAPFWEEVSFSCINCGTCTYSCPTCWCFDIQDENRGSKGTRMRNWDSCMFPLFTLHGSGHNPRDKKTERVRQRFMHKLKYYVDKYDGGIQCVGCGRCVRLCPVNIDIRRVCDLMNTYAAQDVCAVK